MSLGVEFRPSTDIVYPPFKKGRYLEEAFYDFYKNEPSGAAFRVYIPVFWTNLQTDPDFSSKKPALQDALTAWFLNFPPEQKYFAVVQHDDGILFSIPKNTLVFGACTGDVPLPLIYEDTDFKLEREEQLPFSEKGYLITFMGAATHDVRKRMIEYGKKDGQWFICENDNWTPDIQKTKAERFIELVKESKFSLAPRGYGRSSFRFFEVLKLGSIPIYIYDDIEWLPYKECVDYRKICVSIHISELEHLNDKLQITENEYIAYMESYNNVKHMFTLDGMNQYIKSCLQSSVNNEDYF
jgi:hypothetical protein